MTDPAAAPVLHPGAPTGPVPPGDRPLVSRLAMELALAAILFGIGATVVVGALEYKVGWDESGPEPGAFPFYVGLLIMAGSAGAAVQGWLWGGAGETVFASREQGRRVALFFGPVVAFVLVATLLGIYVAMALYLVFTTRVLGRYGWARALAIGLGTAVAFFALFELFFGQPLLKGPLEAALGFG